MLLRRFVLFVRNVAVKFSKNVKEKLLMLFGRFVLFARDVGAIAQNQDKVFPPILHGHT